MNEGFLRNRWCVICNSTEQTQRLTNSRTFPGWRGGRENANVHNGLGNGDATFSTGTRWERPCPFPESLFIRDRRQRFVYRARRCESMRFNPVTKRRIDRSWQPTPSIIIENELWSRLTGERFLWPLWLLVGAEFWTWLSAKIMQLQSKSILISSNSTKQRIVQHSEKSLPALVLDAIPKKTHTTTP